MATTERDYYAVLGLSRTATPDEIKKAYRRLARQYHPDLHGGSKKADMEKKFKELNEANEVLGDPDKRKKYDRYGHRWQEAEAYEKAREQAGAGQGGASGFQWRQESAQGEGQDFGDFFENIFRRGSDTRRGGGAPFEGFAIQGEDLETTVRLTLREVLSGVSRRVQLSEPIPCPTCGGTGRQRGRLCPTCGGTGSRAELRTIDVKIPAGVQDGTRVRVAGKGAPGHNGGKSGDLYLLVQIEPHAVFQRQGSDILVQLPVWPWEAVLGADVLVPTLTDPVRVKVPLGSRAGAKLRLKGKGLPTATGGRGDLFFTLQIVMPPSLSDEDRKLYEELARAPHPDPRVELLRTAGRA
ncbi:MAG TPA: DnaJ C-terminal domain-containing protein [Nitrospiraceae bacterium]|jgi:DnaJ-class molecular chaperone with C-terminal Zn finger domain|nr:DnaJ C-terminal domain-containing protein [Nitrospiraceae bacterium]